jgi:plasmid stabilization system protein ParE
VADYIVSVQADRDVDAQADYYLDHGSPETATRWLLKTRKTFEYAAAHPSLGEEIRPGVRALRVERFRRHIVIYRAVPAPVVIVRVIHGAADLDAAFGH